MLISNITDNIIVNLMPDDEYILVTYKLYEGCIELIDFERKKKEAKDGS